MSLLLRRGRPGLWLCLLLGCAYMATFGGRLCSGDGIEMWRTTRSLLERGTLALEQDTPGRTWGYPGADGRRYSPYALGLSVVQAPFVATGNLAASLLHEGSSARDQVLWAAAVIVNVPVTILCALLVHLVGRSAGYSPRASATAALVYGLGTMAWVYSKHDFAEPLCALSLLGAAWMLMRFREKGREWDLAGAGALNGFGFFTKYQMVLYTPFLLAWLFLATDAGRRRGGALVRALGAFLLPGLAFGLLNLWVNHARFGEWLSTGYGNQGEVFAGWSYALTGLYGLLLSPGKGVFWYNPILLASLLAWCEFHRRSAALSSLTGGLAATTLLTFAPLWWWHGDWAWGPRYLLIPLPFLILPLLAWLDPARGGRPAHILRAGRRAFVAALLIAAAAVNLLGLSVNFFYSLQALSDSGRVHDDWNFLPGLSPLRYHAHVVRAWGIMALGGEEPSFVYTRWKDGELTRISIDMDADVRGPDYFFFRRLDSDLQQAVLFVAGLLFAGGAILCARRLRASLREASP